MQCFEVQSPLSSCLYSCFACHLCQDAISNTGGNVLAAASCPCACTRSDNDLAELPAGCWSDQRSCWQCTELVNQLEYVLMRCAAGNTWTAAAQQQQSDLAAHKTCCVPSTAACCSITAPYMVLLMQARLLLALLLVTAARSLSAATAAGLAGTANSAVVLPQLASRKLLVTEMPTAVNSTGAMVRKLHSVDKIDNSKCSRISEGARVCGLGLVYSCCGSSECFSVRSAEDAARGNGGYRGVCDLSYQSFACCKA